MGFWGSIRQQNTSIANREYEAELRERIKVAENLRERIENDVDIFAPQAGILYNYQIDNKGITIVDIIELPEYLNTWESFIEEIVNQ